MRITIFGAGSQGDIQPCVRLGSRLQQAGLQVLLAAPQNFADLAHGAGLSFHPLRGDVQQIMAGETGQQYMETGGGNPIRSILAMRKMLGPIALQMAEDALEASRQAGALITLAVFAPLGKTIAEICNIPLLLVEPTPVLPTGDFPAPGWPLQKDLGRLHNRLSFTAFVIACLGQAVDQDKSVQACRTWRERLVIFDDVDVNTLFEVEVDGRKIIRPHVIRAANKKTAREIHEEIRAFQKGHAASQEARFIEKFILLPGFVRRLFLRILFKSPQRLKAMNGTVALTSVGMFGAGGGWGLPVSNHTLQITLGGIATRPALLDGQVADRQYLCVTISVDHDLVDGAPAARFAQSLKELVEGRAVLDELIGRGTEAQSAIVISRDTV